MATFGSRHSRSRSQMLAGAGAALAMGLAFAGTAHAQDTTPQSPPAASAAPESEANAGEIVVTGTRVVRNGYDAPTPTTVVGADQINAAAPANIADFVNKLPSFSASATPRTNAYQFSSGLTGINALNLRNLGTNRTLVLLDGQRVGFSSLTGVVDINNFPQALVKRVDVVTGGASASWGSDAVAGVVNFVLDHDFTGVKGQAQGSVTNYGDGKTYNLSLAAGFKFAGDRGHILLAAEQNYDEGIQGLPRDWWQGRSLVLNPTYTASNGQPQLLVLDNVGLATATPGGLITTGPLKGTYFGPGGQPLRFNYGPLVSGPYMQGGDWRYSAIQPTGDLSPRLSRQNFFGRASFDVTDSLKVFVQASYARSHSSSAVSDQFNLGNITIQPDNAFIPASIAPQVTTSFSLGTLNADLKPLIAITDRKSYRGVIGAEGDFGAMGSQWHWDVYGQKSINDIYTAGVASITSRFNNAIDAVRAPNGTIVCRSTLTDPTNGCVPYNVFGTGVNSAAVSNYIQGLSTSDIKLKETVFAGNLRGEPFSTWAGPVSLAAGIEHRRESVDGTNDPLSTTRSYFAGNYRATTGAYNVTEGYLETVVPLAKDVAFAHSLDLNAAVRVTDYSTSGTVVTWKAGLTYAPVPDIKFRVTRSRDIRAPNLAELYQVAGSNTTTTPDPFRNNAISQFISVTQGNLNLKPEKADTLGLGVIFSPRFIPGFQASVDYYNIDVKDYIQTIDGGTTLTQCFAGNAALCNQIVRGAPAAGQTVGPITTIFVQPINLAKATARGLDFEMSYRTELLDGNLSLRALATRFLKNYFNNGVNVPTDTVGTNSANAASFLSLPKWRYLATVAWSKGPLDLSFTARGISSGVYNTSYVQCTSSCPTSTPANMTISNNHIPGAIYFDASAQYEFVKGVQAFVVVENLANTDPVQIGYGTSVGGGNLSVNPALYDIVGRTFRVGIRFKM
jgi:iron complex outermembrane receptor protein